VTLKIDAAICAAARIGCGYDGFDEAFVQQQCLSAHDIFAGENPAIYQRGSHYTVSVILRK
jgi:hypothetical protein